MVSQNPHARIAQPASAPQARPGEGAGAVRKPQGPPAGGKPLNAFSIDVEDYFQVAALASAISRESWPDREYRVEANTELILKLLNEKRVRGTFFVLG
jgi:peptidoglycan/xylan/chitin deacetylase (PgdA/CDA1 family)